MKIQYGSAFGNFKWNAEAEIDEAMMPVLCALGALQVAQRTPSSAAEKALAGYDKRPAGFKRDSIPFSEAGASTLEECLEAMKVEVGRDDKDQPIFAVIKAAVEVVEYIPTVGDVKMTDERNAYARHGKAGDLEAFAKKVGYAGADMGDGTAENAPVEFIRAIRKFSQDALKQL